jgi:ABC-type nitrate/sulfonate/bicarbonate transport system permease component
MSVSARLRYGAAGICIFAVAAFLCWQAMADTGGPTPVYPPLASVAQHFYDVDIWRATGQTLSVLGTAFVTANLVALPLGAAVGLFPTFGAVVYPVLRILCQLPFAALIPLLMLWFGLALAERTELPLLVMFVTIAAGTGRSFGQLPTPDEDRTISVPQRITDAVVSAPAEIFSTLRASLRVGALVLIATECIVGTSGIGALLTKSAMTFEPAKVAAAVLVVWGVLIIFDLALIAIGYAWPALRAKRAASR